MVLIKLETGLRPNSAGIPFTLLLRIEAIGFPTFRLLLYSKGALFSCYSGLIRGPSNKNAGGRYPGSSILAPTHPSPQILHPEPYKGFVMSVYGSLYSFEV